MTASGDDQMTRSAKLMWEDESGSIREYFLNETANTFIGREDNNDIVLPDKKVSKQHATIYWKGESFEIVDQDSSNGTVLNGDLIHDPTPLNDGDRIQIGNATLNYVYLGERLVETKETVPVSDPSEQASPEDASEPRGAAEPGDAMATRVIPGIGEEGFEPPEEGDSEPEEAAPESAVQGLAGLDESFARLIDQLSTAQDAAAELRASNRGLASRLESFVENIGTVEDQLGATVANMADLEGRVSESGINALLEKLSKDPKNVTLLVELASFTELIEDMIKAGSAHKEALDTIRGKIESEIANLSG